MTPASSGEPAGQGARPGSRRAQAAPTRGGEPDASATPDADWTRWFARSDAPADDPSRPLTERERWYREQRPPHWD